MEREVLIRLVGLQRYADQEPDKIELTSEGTLKKEGERLIVSYQESELTGLAGTTTSFEILGEQIVLRRTGAAASCMEFRLGQPHKSLYETAMGTLLITVCATRIENHMEPTGGNLTVCYDITIEDLGAGQIEYHLVVTPL